MHELDGTVVGVLLVAHAPAQARPGLSAVDLLEIAEGMAEPSWTADQDGMLENFNRAALAYAGVSTIGEASLRWRDLVHPDDRAPLLAKWRTAVRTGEALCCELRIRRHDGEMRWHSVRALPLRLGAAAHPRWVGTCTDIQAQRDLQRRRDADALVQRHMVGIVSHDLRGPLHSILLGLDALAMLGPISPRWASTLERIRSAAQGGSRMIHDLLDFTAARHGGGMAIVPRSIDLRDVVDRVIADATADDPRRSMQAHHEGRAVGEWDADRLSQAIGNLVSNAATYGDPERDVTVTTRADGPDDVVIEVHNHGAVIPREIQESLFLPMQRGGSSSGRARRSVGLGLFIVREIATGHGGTIEVESSEPAGTVFRMRLPRRARDELRADPSGASAPAMGAPPSP